MTQPQPKPLEVMSLQEMCEKVPELYEALRLRDSKANHVCELLVRGHSKPEETLRLWNNARKRVNTLVARALNG